MAPKQTAPKTDSLKAPAKNMDPEDIFNHLSKSSANVKTCTYIADSDDNIEESDSDSDESFKDYEPIVTFKPNIVQIHVDNLLNAIASFHGNFLPFVQFPDPDGDYNVFDFKVKPMKSYTCPIHKNHGFLKHKK